MRILVFSGFLLCFTVFNGAQVHAQAQAGGKEPVVFSLENPVVVSPISVSGIISDKTVVVTLWGLKNIKTDDVIFQQKSMEVLQNAMGRDPLACRYYRRGASPNEIIAQCDNSNRQDLGLYMVQEGQAMVDQSVLAGGELEMSYMSAQKRALDFGAGTWEEPKTEQRAERKSSQDMSILVSLVVANLLVMLLAFFVLAVVVMKGFRKVIDLQNTHLDMIFREQKMNEKEREVIMTMIDSELKANKSKIDAYIVVYEETLSELKSSQKTPRYQKLGDIIQMQPALSRGIFDKNSDKIYILGKKFASDLIHFYARIKTNPDYENIEPDMDVNAVVKIVEEALEGAVRLNALADYLIKEIEDGNFDSAEAEEAAKS